MEERERPGRGMKFPPKIDRTTGRFVLADEEESVKDSVYLILMTQKGERPARPDFGSRILSFPFSDTNPTTLHVLERQVKETILTQEPRISEVDVETEFRAEEACLYIHIHYTVAQTGKDDDLTIPMETA
ncbi:GPW/gp25 family protein [Dorea sp. D27]|uniref:GPW/gp25 family protein n=1 Tax=Dorea sp. D27 TaxID=658665 RepID=UPI0006734600|nr:GPW/gp25 family protein [Dorea sp. D27]KMZ53596.1 putative tail lysozyme [Dorea sp. D27]